MDQTALPTRFRDLPLKDFVDRLASADPVPGGGAASAVAASLGAGLVAMVAGLSEGRPRYLDHAALHAWGIRRGRHLATLMLQLAEEDSVAYAELSRVMKLPRETEALQAIRKEAMRSAARLAADVPLRCVRACRDIVAAAESLAGRSNANASSDLNVAALLAEAAARGAAANVLVNLPMVGDVGYALMTRAEVKRLLAQIEQLARDTRGIVERGETRPPIDPGVAPDADPAATSRTAQA